MRALTQEELMWINGGSSDDDPVVVVVHGPSPPSGGTIIMPPSYNPPPLYGGGVGIGVGGGGGPLVPPVHHSDAAKQYASQHVFNLGTTAADAAAYARMMDDVETLYDWAAANPNAQIDISHGQHASGSDIMAQLSRTSFTITDSTGDDVDAKDHAGAATTVKTGQLASININPQFGNEKDWVGEGNKGLDYSVFHEFGHALEWAYNSPEAYASDREGAANTAGRSLENAMGYPMPDDSHYPANWYAP